MNKLRKINTKYIVGIIFLFITQVAMSCPVCDRQNANKAMLGLTHGTGPDHAWKWSIVVAMILITVLALILAIKYFIKPDSKKNIQFKKSIFID